MTLAVGTKLGPYEITGAIGAGGMGEVYKAHDTKLGRDVAIKILPEAFAHDPDRLSRFQREAKMLAALNHPNIATIYGLEQSNGTSYLVMELVSGETLAERIKREGVFPIEEALKIAVQIAEALEAAHEKGIIHRDLKPANVKLTPEGKVKVLDFGLAKAFAGDGASEDPSNSPTLSMAATMHGVILGTAAYMSPEQARGEELDARTDLFSFGVVLYEVATGKLPFQGNTSAVIFNAILSKAPTPPTRLNPELPPKLEEIINKALEKDRKLRCQSAAELRADLSRLKRDTDSGRSVVSVPTAETPSRSWRRGRLVVAIAAVSVVAVLAGAGWFYKSAGRGGETIDSVAVLPFVNASGDPNNEYLSDGITESLINSLSQVPHLKVMSRDSAFMYKGKDTDARTVGQALGVRAIFKGRVMQRGDSMDISAELVDTHDDSHIWGEQYTRKSSDVFALQGEIAKEMTTALRMRLTGEDEKRMAKNSTVNPEAYQDYLKGRYWWNKRTEEGFDKGIEYFQRAIEKDPTYALAYSGLADCYSLLSDYGFVAPKEAFPKAKEAALKALQLDETLAEPHSSLAYVKTLYDWDWSGAEREYQRAIEINPSYATAHHWHAMALMMTGRSDEAIAEQKRALELDPLSLIINRVLGWVLYLGRHYDQAIEQERKTLELDPHFALTHANLGWAYVQKSMYKEGIAECEKELIVSPGNPYELSGLGYAYAVAGRREDAQKVLDKLNQLSKQRYVPARAMVSIHASLGEKDKAFEWLEMAYEERSIGTSFSMIKADPTLDSLRSDPRFADLLQRMNLQP